MDREASVHGSVLQEFHAYEQEGNDNDNASATASGINIISDDVNGDMMRNQAGEQGHGAFVFPADANMASAHPGPSSSSVLPWPLALLNSSSNSNLSLNQFSMPPPIFRDQERFFPSLPPLPPPPPPPPAFYHDQLQFARRASAGIQFGNDGGGLGSSSSDPLGLAGLYSAMGPESFLRGGGLMSSSPLFGGLHAEFGKLTPQEIMDAKALAASKSHSEAERRRRERINAHLARLRSLLPSTTKTDKASLLAEVIQHVKELKRQTSEIAEESPLPTEADELTVDAASDEEGRFLVRASLCCDDRSDLLPDLIKALKALKLRTLKAEITTLGGRVKNVLLITREDDGGGAEDHHQAATAPEQSIASIQDALKAVMERTSSSAEEPSPATTAAAAAAAAAGSIKRQRTANVSGVLEHRSI